MKSLLVLLFATLGVHATALEVGDAAPCVVLKQISANGSESEHCIRDREVTQKFTIIEFFSITCSTCQANLPKVRELGESVACSATTRLVAIDRDEQGIREYISRHRSEIPFEVALDIERDAKRAYDVVSTPTLYVLDQNNQVVYAHHGLLSQQDIDAIRQIVTAH